MKNLFGSKDYRDYIPHPVNEDDPAFLELYYKAWELAFAHIKHIPGMPQTPYMDEAFCDTQIWIWDTCFMSLFCKWGREVFPGVESLKNFYEVLYGEGRLAKVIPTEREPEFTGAVPGEPYEIVIHIADNPPLFALAEYENAKMLGDTDAVRALLYEKQYLQKHYEWIESLRAPERPRGVFNETCLMAEPCGYRWEGGRSGMDNTPRGRIGTHAKGQRPNNPDMLWVDAICQQALSAERIAALFRAVGDEENAALWQGRYEEKKQTVQKLYWDGEDGFFYDIDRRDRHFYKVKTMGSFWALTAAIATQEQAERMAAYLSDERHFGGSVPFAALSRSDPDFHADGQYWRGGVWLPTAYAALLGMKRYGLFADARSHTKKLLAHMYETYRSFEPHTIWECYAPCFAAPACIETGEKKYARKDFCGWSALGPISAYIEFYLGFHTVDAFEGRVYWEKPEAKGRIGIKNLRFGKVVTDIVAEGPRVFVRTSRPYTLVISGREYPLRAGENEILHL